jgi:hypothetical protein
VAPDTRRSFLLFVRKNDLVNHGAPNRYLTSMLPDFWNGGLGARHLPLLPENLGPRARKQMACPDAELKLVEAFGVAKTPVPS